MDAKDSGPSSPRIGSRSTAAAWILGTVLLAAGAVAVFVTKNAAGSVALIAAGAAFILTAAWRHLPSSIKAGGYELIWTAYETGRQQVVEDISKSVAKGQDSEEIKAKLREIEASYEIERSAQMIDLLKTMLDRGLLDTADVDTDWLRNSFRRGDPEPDR